MREEMKHADRAGGFGRQFSITVVIGAVIALIVAMVTVHGAASAETPAERCERETNTYNSAWAQSWATANDRPASEAPSPPVPYICHDPGTPTPTTPTQPTMTAPELPTATQTAPGAGPVPTVHAPTDIPEPGDTPIVEAPGRPVRPSAGVPVRPTPAPAEVTTAEDPAEQQAPAYRRKSPLYGHRGDCGTDMLPLPTGSRTPEQTEAYNRLRPQSDRYKDRRDDVEDEINGGGKWPEIAPGESFQLDHIIALDRLVRAPGFTDLSPDVQDRIANSEANTRPLPSSWNGSKSKLSYAEWPDRDPTGAKNAPTRSEWEQLCAEESRATVEVRRMIAEELAKQEQAERGTTTGTDDGSSTPTVTAIPDTETAYPGPTDAPVTEQPDTPTTRQPEIPATVQPEITVSPQPEIPATQHPEIPSTTQPAPTSTTATTQDTTPPPGIRPPTTPNTPNTPAPQTTEAPDDDPSWWERNRGTIGKVALGAAVIGGVGLACATGVGCAPAVGAGLAGGAAVAAG
ncbi:hypothetical protein [Gordonia neofelifaecis]|nr:hypothetical protein [Gordonia neofelifaecis]